MTKMKTDTFWARWTAPKPLPERWTPAWYLEMAYVSLIFGCTGTSTMYLVRPAVASILQLKGTMRDGPWAYRIGTVVVMFPVYPLVLLTFGTIGGRHVYFRQFAIKMLARFGIPKAAVDPFYRGKTPQQIKEYEKSIRKW